MSSSLHPPSSRNSQYERHTHTLSSSPAPHEQTTNPVTLTRFLHAEQSLRFPHTTGTFTMLLQSIQLAVKVIAAATRKAGIANLYGLAGGVSASGGAPAALLMNSSGDSQKKLDVYANDAMVGCLTYSEQASVLVSEEEDEPIVVEGGDGEGGGGYAVVFDPLDGSSNIDCNISVGTIFGIYSKPQRKRPQQPSAADVLRPGSELIAAGYASYDTATMLVLTTGNGVNGFTLDPSLGEFILTHRNVRIPASCKLYSVNEGNSAGWEDGMQRFISGLKQSSGWSARYVGSMVGDVHRSLLYGGIFLYPADRKSRKGKLRLLYECNPIAMLVEEAGGLAVRMGGGLPVCRIRDIRPTEIHERCPIACGSRDAVNELIRCYQQADPSTHRAKL